jgi:hypothetical protein
MSPFLLWVGTNDTPTSGYWSPTNNTGTSNMVEVSANVYDNGGVGDGNLTESIQFPLPPAGEGEGEGAAASTFRVTEMLYDWQDRMIATKSGALVTEVTSGTSGAEKGTFYFIDPPRRFFASAGTRPDGSEKVECPEWHLNFHKWFCGKLIWT